MKLYELSVEFERLIKSVDEDWCLLESAEEELQKIEMSVTEKANSIWIVMQWYDNEVDVYDKEIKRLTKLKKASQNNKERIKNYLDRNLKRVNLTEVKTDLFRFAYRKSETLQVDEDAELPDEFLKVAYSPNKIEIKKYLKSWNELKWCSIVVNKNLQVY